MCGKPSLVAAVLWIGLGSTAAGADETQPPPDGKAPPPRAERIFERWDQNHDGVIDKQEFMQGFHRFMEHRRAARRGPDEATDGPRGPGKAAPPRRAHEGRGRGPAAEGQGRGPAAKGHDAPPLEGPGRASPPPPGHDRGQDPGLGELRTQRRQARADRILHRLDRNGDGAITADEFTGDPKRFESLDANGDGQLTRDELIRTPGPMRQRRERPQEDGPPNPPPPDGEQEQ